MRAWRYMAGVVLVVAGAGWGAVVYRTADLGADIFGGEVTIVASDRAKGAGALARLVRDKVLVDNVKDVRTAARVLGLALRLDPENELAKKLDADLTAGKVEKLPPVQAATVERLIGDVRAVADAVRRSKRKPDEMLAAYLYAANLLIDGNETDRALSTGLWRAGRVVSWRFADDRLVEAPGRRPENQGRTPAPAAGAPSRQRPAGGAGGAKEKPAGPAAVSAGERDGGPQVAVIEPGEVLNPLPRPELRPVTVVRGLVVSLAGDGLWHGQAMDIIATASSARSPSVRTMGAIGEEMTVALREAVRVVRLRRPEIDSAAVEISFDDKYSPVDGGSAGTAFTLALLASLGEFDPNPEAAVTGDVTVDSRVRRVGEVPAKVRGAALDGCRIVAVPAPNAGDMQDAVVLRGPAALWEAQIFSVRTVDEAIAVMRKDPSPELARAMGMFEELKREWEGKAPKELGADAEARGRLAKVLELAPNHVSAAGLMKLASGEVPKHLSVATTLSEAMAATSGIPFGVDAKRVPPPVPAGVLAAARKNLARIRQVADPSTVPVVKAIDDFCVTYSAVAGAANAPRPNPIILERLIGDLRVRSDALISALQKVTSDRDLIDKMMRS